MSRWSRNGHGWDEAESFDDALVEELLAGRYEGDIPELIAVSQFVEKVRALADQPVPPPSAALTKVLGHPAPDSDAVPSATGRRWLRDLRVGPFLPAGRPRAATGARSRSRPVAWPAMAAAVCAVLVAAVVAAGSARLLPGPTQNVVASIVRTMTPFGFPEQREPEPALSKTPAPRGGPEDRGAGARVDGSAPDGAGQPRRNAHEPAGHSGDGSRSQPDRVNAAPVPATTALAPRSAPRVPRPNERSSPGPTTSSVPPPPPEPTRFTAELSGANGTPDAADSDGSGTAALDVRGSNELCLTLVVSDTAPVTSAHLHAGPTDMTGPVVAAFEEPTAGTSGPCVTVPDQLIDEIRADPGRYYVDVHTTEFPDEALRGQLAS